MMLTNLKLFIVAALVIAAFLSCTKTTDNPLTSTSLNPPSLYLPANHSVTDSLTATLIWNSVANAAMYEFQVSSTINFNDTLLADSIPQNYRTITKWDSLLTTNTTYYWRVRAINSNGMSAWSPIWHFSVYILRPYIISFSYSYKDISRTPVFQWDTVPGHNTVKYQVQAAKGHTFDTLVVNGTATADSFVVTQPLAYGTSYQLRIRAISQFDTSDWSATSYFYTVYDMPGKTILSYPANGSTGISRSSSLSWIYENGTATYDVVIDTTPNFSTMLYQYSGPSSWYYLSTVMPNTTYYWRVRTTNASGTGPWSDTWSFTTASFIQLLYPLNGTTNVGSPATLAWTGIPGVSKYWVKLSNSYGTIINDSTITGTSINAVISSSYTCYWQVCGIYPNGTRTEWTSQWSFKR